MAEGWDTIHKMIKGGCHMHDKKLKILFVSAEMFPFAKTGGLADVAGSLPKALAEMGHDVRVVMPKYRQIDEHFEYVTA